MKCLSQAAGYVLSAIVLALATVIIIAPARAQFRPVDVALVLALDASSSITHERWGLQVMGYTQAFQSDDVIAALESGAYGAIAVTVVQWSGKVEQRQIIGWTVLSDRESAYGFASAIRHMPREFAGNTAIGSAITYATTLLKVERFRSARRIIDISGDGISNEGLPPDWVRPETIQLGIVINGLPIMSGELGIDVYYRERVIGGQGSFIEAATDFHDFARAIRKKLVRELGLVQR